MSQRLTRKDIKRDEVMETVGSAVDWVSAHARTIVYSIVAVIVVIVVGLLVRGYVSDRAARASEALAHALEVYAAPVDELAPRPDDPDAPVFATAADRDARSVELFRQVRSDFGGTIAAGVAGVYLGEMAARDGRLDEARELWEGFADGGGDDMLTAQVRVNLMELDRRQGRSEELVDRLRAELEQPQSELPTEVVLHQLAVTLEGLDRTEEARGVYQRIVDEFPSSAYRAGARRRLDVLGG